MRKQNEISDALMGEECTYENNEHSEIELAFDETGLWASYCQNGTHGNIVLSRLDMYTLERKRTYHSTMHKNWMVNSFIACGKFYGLRKGTNPMHLQKAPVELYFRDKVYDCDELGTEVPSSSY